MAIAIKKSLSLFVLVAVLTFLAGCASREELPASRAEATQKFIQILENDYGYKPVVRWAGETLWIYLPCQEDLYKISAGTGASKPTPKAFSLEFIEGVFKDNVFSFEYDVIPATKVAAGSGLGTGYSDGFQARYQNITNSLSQSFFSSDLPPRFVVVAIADTREGLMIKNTLALIDLKKYYAAALPPDEYSLRIKTDFLGDKDMIGDDKGRKLEYTDVVLTDFLINQMVRRIQYKFQGSDFPPQETPQDEILKMIATVTAIYDFSDYASVVLHDLREKRNAVFTRAQIEERQDKSILEKEKEAGEGRVISLDFSQFLDGQPEGALPKEGTGEPVFEDQPPAEFPTNTAL